MPVRTNPSSRFEGWPSISPRAYYSLPHHLLNRTILAELANEQESSTPPENSAEVIFSFTDSRKTKREDRVETVDAGAAVPISAPPDDKSSTQDETSTPADSIDSWSMKDKGKGKKRWAAPGLLERFREHRPDRRPSMDPKREQQREGARQARESGEAQRRRKRT